MPRSEKKRLFRLLRGSGVFLLTGGLYGLLINHFGAGIPCPVRLLTGLKCPGCGVSTMCLRLFRLDIKGAFNANPVVFCLLPAGVFMTVCLSIRYIRSGKARLTKTENIIAYCVCGILVIFGILRNIAF